MSSSIEQYLDSVIQDVPSLQLAVFASVDGLVLAQTSRYDVDSGLAAACASELLRQTQLQLSTLIPGTEASGVLFWTSSGAWYIERVAKAGVLLLQLSDVEHVGLARVVARNLAVQLNKLL